LEQNLWNNPEERSNGLFPFGASPSRAERVEASWRCGNGVDASTVLDRNASPAIG